jgi:Zn-dependent protease with chaperone function
MSAGLVLMLYAILLTWVSPVLLRRLDARGLAPRLAVAAWLTAMVATIAAWGMAIVLLFLSVVSNGHDVSAMRLCLHVIGVAGHFDVPGRRPVTFLVVSAAAIGTVMIVGRVVRAARRLQANSLEHAQGIRIVGTATDTPGVVLIDAAEPSAYCVAGRPDAIVVTTAALNTLTRAELGAVLAHERAHLNGRHHHILTAVRAIAASVPRLPLFADGLPAVSSALEMCADDAAARRHGAAALLSGLIKLAGRPALAAQRMGAADSALVARALRLAAPAPPASQWGLRIISIAAMAVTITAPVISEFFCL